MVKLKTMVLVISFSVVLTILGCSGNDTGTVTDAGEEVTATGEVKIGEIKEIKMVAKRWAFIPENIEVNLGDTVRLTVESADVDHGIYLPAFGVSEFLEAGKKTEIEFVAAKKGSFPFRCSVACGRGHGTMGGQLIVR